MQLWGYCSGETDRCPRGFNPHSNSYNSSSAVYSTSNLSDTLTYIIIDMRRIRKSFHSHPVQRCPCYRSLFSFLIFPLFFFFFCHHILFLMIITSPSSFVSSSALLTCIPTAQVLVLYPQGNLEDCAYQLIWERKIG